MQEEEGKWWVDKRRKNSKYSRSECKIRESCKIVSNWSLINCTRSVLAAGMSIRLAKCATPVNISKFD